MKVALLFKGGKKAASGAAPDQELMAQVGRFLADLKLRGIMLDGFGLKPPRTPFPREIEDQAKGVTDGPFAETKEVLGGIWIWRVDSIPQAWEILATAPRPENLNPEDHGVVEIREVYEDADYGESYVKATKEA